MRARDLAEPYPIVAPDTDALQAALAMVADQQPCMIICSEHGKPYSVLAGPALLRTLLPAYLQDDPGLARALDEQASDDLFHGLARRTVSDALPRPADRDDLPVVDADATALEVAAVMARMGSPLVVDSERVIGAITVSRLLGHLLPSSPEQP